MAAASGALAGDVADHHRPLRRRAREHVVEVAADLVELARRAVARGQRARRGSRAAASGSSRACSMWAMRVRSVYRRAFSIAVAGAAGELLGELDVGGVEPPAPTRRWRA